MLFISCSKGDDTNEEEKSTEVAVTSLFEDVTKAEATTVDFELLEVGIIYKKHIVSRYIP